MILGDLRAFAEEAHLYPPAVRRAVGLIIERQIGELASGRYELDGDEMFALVQDVRTGPIRERRPEAHRTYADIQLVVRGEERIGYCRPSPELRPIEDAWDTRDIAFYGEDLDGESQLILTPGLFAVFFPPEIHRPCCDVEAEGIVKKVVVKIHRRLLEA